MSKIVEVQDIRESAPTLAELTDKLDAARTACELASDELDVIIHEAHMEDGRK